MEILIDVVHFYNLDRQFYIHYVNNLYRRNVHFKQKMRRRDE